MNIIAIDCGASFIKAARVSEDAVTVEKKILYKTNQEVSLVDDKDSKLPIILRNTISAIKKSLLDLTNEGETVFLGICNEMHGFVLTDSELIPCFDYVSWQRDYIMEPYDEKETWQQFFLKGLDAEDIRKTGMPFKSGLPSGNLAYLILQSVDGQGGVERKIFYSG